MIDGIRNPAEIEELRKSPDSKIVGLAVNEELIVERILSRKRDGDALSRGDILKKIAREKGKESRKMVNRSQNA